MAASVQVLCPNGRRQNVKVTPNTKLLQILEEVCSKQGFLPPDEYNLIHGRTTVDLTLAFRFSGLSNNAKLELVKALQPRSLSQGEVTIALQLESGDRLQESFQPSTTLWDILMYWELQDEGGRKGQLTGVDSSQSPPIHPVCIYMREEVIGEYALQNMTLKKLALTSGKAIIRLVHRPVEDSTLEEIKNKIEQEEAKQARLAAKAQEMELSESLSQASQSLIASSSISAQDQTHSDQTMEVDSSQEEHLKKEKERVAAERIPSSSGFTSEPMETQDVKPKTLPTSSTPASDNNSLVPLGTSGFNTVPSSTRKTEAKPLSAIEQLRRMNIPGVDIITPEDFYDLSPEQQQIARQLAHQLMPGLFQAPNTHQEGAKPKNTKSRQPFADFKFPEETKGKELYQNELSQLKREEFQPCDREAVVFDSNEDIELRTVPQEVTDEFFEVTETDVKSMMRDMQRQVSLMNERPLMTEAMRMAEMEERYKHYEYVVLRVQFPDGLVLQGCFRVRETVFALYTFVKEHLDDKDQQFYLYVSPPKRMLSDMAKTLVQADLAPASVVYFGSVTPKEHSLATSAVQEITSKRRAEEISVKRLTRRVLENSRSCTESFPQSLPENNATGKESEAITKPSSAGSREGTSSSAQGKVPKWLKLGK